MSQGGKDGSNVRINCTGTISREGFLPVVSPLGEEGGMGFLSGFHRTITGRDD